MISDRKQKIEKSFGQKTHSYEQNALLQKECAKKLSALLPDTQPLKILEIGCGTGFLTSELQQKYPQAHILCIDISKNMVLACQQKFTGYRNLSFQIADGENFLIDEKFDLIASNLTVQWFDDPINGLDKMRKNLTKDGSLYFSTIGSKSFWQWEETLKSLSFPSGLLEIPSYKGVIKEEEENISYDNALSFLKSLKNIGAQNSRENYTPLSPVELWKACESFNTTYKGEITWHILYGRLSSLP